MIRRIIYFLHRLKSSLTYVLIPFKHLILWLFNSQEITNYTYDLTNKNERYLASLISIILNVEFSKVLEYMDELKNNEVLIDHIKSKVSNNKHGITSDASCKFGKRLGWYAIARIMKPRIIVETGVDKGFGSCILAAAIIKNEEEGYDGFYYGTDINKEAGFMFSGKYANYGKIIYGDSIESLTNLSEDIDLFINDSDHSAEYEESEYNVIAGKLSDKAIILGDNSHVTDKLLNFSHDRSRNFIFFREEPLNHWYPGGGIGISFVSQNTINDQ